MQLSHPQAVYEWEYACSDTARIVARVLTSRAVQRILIQLQETDLFVAQWLADYCNSHPPMTGDKVS